jgi:hypothetical protein
VYKMHARSFIGGCLVGLAICSLLSINFGYIRVDPSEVITRENVSNYTRPEDAASTIISMEVGKIVVEESITTDLIENVRPPVIPVLPRFPLTSERPIELDGFGEGLLEAWNLLYPFQNQPGVLPPFERDHPDLALQVHPTPPLFSPKSVRQCFERIGLTRMVLLGDSTFRHQFMDMVFLIATGRYNTHVFNYAVERYTRNRLLQSRAAGGGWKFTVVDSEQNYKKGTNSATRRVAEFQNLFTATPPPAQPSSTSSDWGSWLSEEFPINTTVDAIRPWLHMKDAEVPEWLRVQTNYTAALAGWKFQLDYVSETRLDHVPGYTVHPKHPWGLEAWLKRNYSSMLEPDQPETFLLVYEMGPWWVSNPTCNGKRFSLDGPGPADWVTNCWKRKLEALQKWIEVILPKLLGDHVKPLFMFVMLPDVDVNPLRVLYPVFRKLPAWFRYHLISGLFPFDCSYILFFATVHFNITLSCAFSQHHPPTETALWIYDTSILFVMVQLSVGTRIRPGSGCSIEFFCNNSAINRGFRSG